MPKGMGYGPKAMSKVRKSVDKGVMSDRDLKRAEAIAKKRKKKTTKKTTKKK